jgi:Zinc carboxypeptidase
LPTSDKVPTPQKFLGYIAGTPEKLTYSEDIYRYLRALETASPRIKIFSIGKTEEGREMILAVIANEDTISNIDRYKDITRKLSDPRKINETEAEQLIQQGKPMYYLTGALHSPETGSPEMLIELAYRLVVEETPVVQSIRNNIITLITPVLEVDGRNRMVDLVRWQQANSKAPLPPLIYWGHYVAHDNNRDYLGLSLALTRHALKTFFEYHPQVRLFRRCIRFRERFTCGRPNPLEKNGSHAEFADR